jgi:hypothetical protein
MTPLEDNLRAAMRATAEKIPPGPPPPLTLPQRHRLIGPAGPGSRLRRKAWLRPQAWRGWAVPLAGVFLVGAIVAGSLALASLVTGRQTPTSGPFPPQPNGVRGVPAYYVALTSVRGEAPGLGSRTTATIRATVSGKVLATVAVPRPYHAFTEVAGAGDDRTFVLVAEEGQAPDAPSDLVNGTPPLARFYVLHLDPGRHTAAGQVRLQALPATYIPAGNRVLSVALSANGTSLAASIGPPMHNKLYVFNLATGHQHVWSWSACSRCGASGIGPAFAGPNPGVLSWTGDGKKLAFIFLGARTSEDGVRLLDTDALSTNLLADSKLVVTAPAPTGLPSLRQAIIAPDGRTILAVLELVNVIQHVGQQLVTFSATTGQQTAVLNQPPVRNDYEQIQWTSPTGSKLLISGAQKGGGAGVLKNGRYTPVPWFSKIFAAAW